MRTATKSNRKKTLSRLKLSLQLLKYLKRNALYSSLWRRWLVSYVSKCHVECEHENSKASFIPISLFAGRLLTTALVKMCILDTPIYYSLHIYISHSFKCIAHSHYSARIFPQWRIVAVYAEAFFFFFGSIFVRVLFELCK